jgi:hypothetical protein
MWHIYRIDYRRKGNDNIRLVQSIGEVLDYSLLPAAHRVTNDRVRDDDGGATTTSTSTTSFLVISGRRQEVWRKYRGQLRS